MRPRDPPSGAKPRSLLRQEQDARGALAPFRTMTLEVSILVHPEIRLRYSPRSPPRSSLQSSRPSAARNAKWVTRQSRNPFILLGCPGWICASSLWAMRPAQALQWVQLEAGANAFSRPSGRRQKIQEPLRASETGETEP